MPAYVADRRGQCPSPHFRQPPLEVSVTLGLAHPDPNPPTVPFRLVQDDGSLANKRLDPLIPIRAPLLA